MELQVFESNDGALVAALPSAQAQRVVPGLHFVGDACIGANALTPELRARLDCEGFAVAQREDVRTLIRSMNAWVAPLA